MKSHSPGTIINYLHTVGCSNDIMIFQDLMLAREGCHCEIQGHVLVYDPETEEWVVD